MFTMTFPAHLVELAALDLFRGCSARELRVIDQLATVLDVPAGRVLCQKGEPGRECFVVLAGVAVVHEDSGYSTVGPGSTVGELALLSPEGRRTASVTAATDMTVLVLSRSEFARMLERVPSVSHKILQEATRRLIENAGH